MEVLDIYSARAQLIVFIDGVADTSVFATRVSTSADRIDTRGRRRGVEDGAKREDERFVRSSSRYRNDVVR